MSEAQKKLAKSQRERNATPSPSQLDTAPALPGVIVAAVAVAFKPAGHRPAKKRPGIRAGIFARRAG
jgi:hypothetical protein